MSNWMLVKVTTQQPLSILFLTQFMVWLWQQRISLQTLVTNMNIKDWKSNRIEPLDQREGYVTSGMYKNLNPFLADIFNTKSKKATSFICPDDDLLKNRKFDVLHHCVILVHALNFEVLQDAYFWSCFFAFCIRTSNEVFQKRKPQSRRFKLLCPPL